VVSGTDAPWDDLGTDTGQPAVAAEEEPVEVELPDDADPLLRIREEKESEEIKQLRESGRLALNLLAQLIRNFQLYGADNAVFVKPLTDFEQVLRELFGRLGEVRLLVVEGQPYLGELRIRVDTSTTTAVTFLASWLERHGLGGWSFSPPPDSDALRAFLALVARARFKGDDPVEYARSWLLRAGFDWMEPIPPQRFREEGEEVTGPGATSPDMSHVFAHGVSAIRGFFGMLGKAGVGSVLDARKAVQSMVDMAVDERRNTLALGLMAELDDPLLTHSMHVANLAVAIGRQLEVPRALLAELGLCGLLHDTGFCDLPDDLGELPDQEFEVVRIMDHPVLGFRLQIRHRGYHSGRLLRAVVNLEHHLEYAGERRAAWDEPSRPIHPFSRVVAVADAYDTLLTDTASRKAMLPTAALREIWRGKGVRFDPVVVQALVNIMGLYPFGSVLQLSDGSLAVVVAQGASREAFSRPGVRVLAAGGRLRKHETVDLSRIPTGDLGVVDILDPNAMGIDLLDALFVEKGSDLDG